MNSGLWLPALRRRKTVGESDDVIKNIEEKPTSRRRKIKSSWNVFSVNRYDVDQWSITIVDRPIEKKREKGRQRECNASCDDDLQLIWCSALLVDGEWLTCLAPGRVCWEFLHHRDECLCTLWLHGVSKDCPPTQQPNKMSTTHCTLMLRILAIHQYEPLSIGLPYIVYYSGCSPGCRRNSRMCRTNSAKNTAAFYTRKQLLLLARLSHRNSVRLFVCHTDGSVKKRRKLGSSNLRRRLPRRL